ncbi:MAG: hypothetical protein NT069_31970 [Planctomycetota bacterium]|nr:hypothetical protein [Planctomycetota bacterium]
MMEAFRFIHTSQLRLDQQLSGLRRWDGLDRRSLRDCTLTAFSRVVDACITHTVDLLLITVDCWPEDGRSVRGAYAFQQACQRLLTAGIPVCVVVNDLGDFEEGLCGLKLPRGVSVLSCGRPQEVVVSGPHGRRARLRTVVDSMETSEADPIRPVPESSVEPFRGMGIGISCAVDRLLVSDTPFSVVGGAPFDPHLDYIAPVHPGPQRTLMLGNNTVHSPGPAQGLSPKESGSCGCTLVEWNAGDEPVLTHLPVAPFCWEQWAVELNAQSTPESLQREMLGVVRKHIAEFGDATCLVRWNLIATGWSDRVEMTSAAINRLMDGVDTAARREGIHLVTQSVLSLPAADDEASSDDSLWNEFEKSLSSRFSSSRDGVSSLASPVASRLELDRVDFEHAVALLSPVRVANEALAAGQKWLVRTEAIDA